AAPPLSATGHTFCPYTTLCRSQIEAALGSATASDTCSSVTPSASDSAVTSSSCSRSQTRTWTAADACGNIATPVSRIVTWTVDKTEPVLTVRGTDRTRTCPHSTHDQNPSRGTASTTNTSAV